MNSSIDQASLDNCRASRKVSYGFNSKTNELEKASCGLNPNTHGLEEPQIEPNHQGVSQRQLNDNAVQAQPIILFDGSFETKPLNSIPQTSTFKTTSCTIIGVLSTIIVLSVFFIFAAPYIPAFRDRMIQSAEGRPDLISTKEIAPTIDNQTASKSVSASVEVLPEYAQWNYWSEPKKIAQFEYIVLDQSVFSFQSIIPKSSPAKQMKLKIFIRSYAERQHIDMWTRIRIVNGNEEFKHWSYHSVHPTPGLIVTEQTFIVPIDKTREVRIQSNYKRNNWLYCSIFVEAWR